jgi:hypothetical protein
MQTQLALSVAAAADTHVERLQVLSGRAEEKAIGQFDEGLQRLYMEFSKGQHGRATRHNVVDRMGVRRASAEVQHTAVRTHREGAT